MKKSSSESAFTLIEVLVVIFVLALLAALLLPAFADRKPPFNARCLYNQKQLAIGFILYESDHRGQFPWQLRDTNGTMTEFVGDGHAASQFKATADYLKSLNVFICPSDHTKTVAINYTVFTDSNTSYFVGFDAGTNQAFNILTGDRHLEASTKPVVPGLFVYSNGISMNWTRELHGGNKLLFGCLGFTDGHAEVVRGLNLTSTFERQGSVINRFAVP